VASPCAHFPRTFVHNVFTACSAPTFASNAFALYNFLIYFVPHIQSLRLSSLVLIPWATVMLREMELQPVPTLGIVLM
jgi:hypothetical protein